MTTQKRRLGDVAFLTHEDGSITRTIVNKVGQDGRFSLLEYSPRPPHFSFEEAVAESAANLQRKLEEIQAALEKVKEQVLLVTAPDYERQVMAAPFKRVTGNVIASAFGLDGEVQDISPPASYMEPGDRVYAVITPETHNMMRPHYRPYAYFVLESTVREAQLMWGGRVTYRLDSDFNPKDLYAEADEAIRSLVNVFCAETSGELLFANVNVVSQQEERDANQASSERIREQVNRQFAARPID